MDELYPIPDMESVELVGVLRAVADPIRMRILDKLRDGAPCPKTAGFWDLGIQKSTLSHHFKALREAGVTRTIIDGRTHAIQLRREELDERFPGLLDALLRSAPAVSVPR